MSDGEPKPPTRADEAEAAAEWAEMVRLIGSRVTKPLSIDLGPVKGPALKLRKRGPLPLPPREGGLASLEKGLRHAFEVVSRDNSYRFIRSGIVSSMCSDVDGVVDLIDELVADDEKAGLLMERIAALAARWATFEREEGRAPLMRELKSYEDLHETRKDGGDGRGDRLHDAALAKWDDEPKRLWEINQRDLPPERRMSNEELLKLILDEEGESLRYDDGRLPSDGTIMGHIRRWRKGAGMSGERRVKVSTSRRGRRHLR